MIKQAETIQSYSTTFKNSCHNVKALSLFMLIREDSLSSFGSNLESLQQWQCQSTSLQPAISSKTPFRFDLNFTLSSVIIFHLFAVLPSLFTHSLLIIHFWKMSHEFMTRTQEGLPHKFCCLYKLNNRYAVNNHQETVKEVTWLVDNHDSSQLFTQ